MECLETEILARAAEFKNSNFGVNEANFSFSPLPVDQAHEQNNKIVNVDGVAIGLTESSTQLLYRMVSGPEMSGTISSFPRGDDLEDSLVTRVSPFVISVW